MTVTDTDPGKIAAMFLAGEGVKEGFRAAIREAESMLSIVEEAAAETEYNFAQLLAEQGAYTNKDGVFEHYIDDDGLERVKFTPAAPPTP